MIDTVKGAITYATAGLAILGSMILVYLAWTQPIPEGGGRDIAILTGFLGLIVGAAVAFLFNNESATRATRSAQLSSSQGAAQALASPGDTIAAPEGPHATTEPDPISGNH